MKLPIKASRSYLNTDGDDQEIIEEQGLIIQFDAAEGVAIFMHQDGQLVVTPINSLKITDWMIVQKSFPDDLTQDLQLSVIYEPAPLQIEPASIQYQSNKTVYERRKILRDFIKKLIPEDPVDPAAPDKTSQPQPVDLEKELRSRLETI